MEHLCEQMEAMCREAGSENRQEDELSDDDGDPEIKVLPPEAFQQSAPPSRHGKDAIDRHNTDDRPCR